jgi:hypothetical protein
VVWADDHVDHDDLDDDMTIGDYLKDIGVSKGYN